MQRWLETGTLMIGMVVLGVASPSPAQPSQGEVEAPSTAPAAAGGHPSSFAAPGWYDAPGYYGMAYGVESFGMPRTYTVFSSPYGGGYGYGYAPYAFLPGRYGVGLWRPGFVAPGYVYGAGYYRTFPVPLRPWVGGYGAAPVGAYAPAFGPGPFYGF